MSLRQALYSRQFDDYASVNPQISIVLANYLAFIGYVDWLLLLDLEAKLFKLNWKRVLVHLLKKAGAERIVNLVSATDDLLSEVIIFHRILREKKEVI
jgi:hypothetical protein